MNRKSEKKLLLIARNSATILFILFIIMLICILVKLNSNFDNDGRIIKDEKTFVSALLNNNSTKQNQNYYIANAFDINIESLPQENIIFYGNLDGRGYQINIKSKNTEPAYLEHPILYKIENDANISGLNIKLEKSVILGSVDGKKDCALLSNYNYGSINNCFVEVERQCIGKNCSNAASLVNYNFSEISNVCLKLKELSAVDNSIGNWKCRFGALVTINFGVVENILADIHFELDISTRLDVFRNGYNNQFVGYLFCELSKNSKVSDIYLFGRTEQGVAFPYWEKACDTGIIGYNKKDYLEITDSFFLELRKNADWENYWKLDKTEDFPVLNIGQKHKMR
ncbi:MAG: hypothetical protein NC090_07260 [Anaeroplasma bactoclasticum]|nr:hypothetical protein [Anaeroplasma bactoclasticum]MCM1195655.1 hypothetical protein [Roseburia sp.]MCM1514771.1 hypothetical protein [Anaeroplasma bactoclasticum]MCM1556112.1 hypothetical protein [Anaeroplasma bactoclasticum]